MSRNTCPPLCITECTQLELFAFVHHKKLMGVVDTACGQYERLPTPVFGSFFNFRDLLNLSSRGSDGLIDNPPLFQTLLIHLDVAPFQWLRIGIGQAVWLRRDGHILNVYAEHFTVSRRLFAFAFACLTTIIEIDRETDSRLRQ